MNTLEELIMLLNRLGRTCDRRSSAAGKTWIGFAAILIASSLAGAAVIQETEIDQLAKVALAGIDRATR
jgi:hypothetical protein